MSGPAPEIDPWQHYLQTQRAAGAEYDRAVAETTAESARVLNAAWTVYQDTVKEAWDAYRAALYPSQGGGV